MAAKSVQDKIQTVMHPAAPATCIVCHKSANGIVPYVDFQMDLDYYGAVLFCIDCASQMLEVLDYCPVAERDSALRAVEELNAALTESEDKNDKLIAALDAITNLHVKFSSDHSAYQEPAQSNEDTDREFDTTESGLIEPDSKWESEDVPQSKF